MNWQVEIANVMSDSVQIDDRHLLMVRSAQHGQEGIVQVADTLKRTISHRSNHFDTEARVAQSHGSRYWIYTLEQHSRCQGREGVDR
jgi:hypothetical protein